MDAQSFCLKKIIDESMQMISESYVEGWSRNTLASRNNAKQYAVWLVRKINMRYKNKLFMICRCCGSTYAAKNLVRALTKPDQFQTENNFDANVVFFYENRCLEQGLSQESNQTKA